MSKKNCELCNKPARIFCESDQASLCFHCDEKVHAANFLVAKHSRTLLCHVCRSPTPWSAHGPKLGPTVSVCHACSTGRRGSDNNVNGGDITAAAASTSNSQEGIEDNEYSYTEESNDDDDQFDDDEDDDSVYDIEEGGEGENQVVPWSEVDATWHSDGVETSDLEINYENNNSSLSGKRARDRDDTFEYEDDETSSFRESDDTSSSELRPSKIQRRNEETSLERDQTYSGTAAIIEKLQSFQREITKPLA